MDTMDLSMNQREAVKQAIKSINWSYGKGEVKAVEYTDNEIGSFYRKLQYGHDKRKYRIEERITGVFVHCLEHTRKI